MPMQSTLHLDINPDDTESVAAAIKALGEEWDIDCKDAFELGLFDIDRETWIAQGMKHQLVKWVPAVRYYTGQELDLALDALHAVAQYYDRDAGLPLDTYLHGDLREALLDKLGLYGQRKEED